MTGDTRLPAAPAVTGISVVQPDKRVLRIGQFPVKGTHHRGVKAAWPVTPAIRFCLLVT